MKKMAKILTLILALMLCMTTASAGVMVPNVSVPELGIEVYVPAYLTIATRDMSDGDEVLALLGMDRATVVEYMEANQLYVDAFPSDLSFSYELTVAGEPNDVSGFRVYGDALIEEVCKMMPETYEAIGMTVSATDIYKNDGADYIKIYYTDGTSGACVLQYFTIVDHQAINFRIFNYAGGAVTAEQESIIKTVVDNTVFK